MRVELEKKLESGLQKHKATINDAHRYMVGTGQSLQYTHATSRL